jgi:ABC-2 type transport system permease protein
MMLLSPVILSVVIPITWGPNWLAEVPPLIVAFLITALLVGVMIPDSFAGERERHTLGTLLASQLPDRAILFGKLVIPIAVGWSAALLFAVVALVVVNVAHGEGQLILYTPPIALGIPALSFLAATMMAGAGVLTSLRSETVQEATQKLMVIIMVPAMVLQLVPLLLRDQMVAFIEAADGPTLLLTALVVLAVVDVVVLWVAMARFQRSHMYLD